MIKSAKKSICIKLCFINFIILFIILISFNIILAT